MKLIRITIFIGLTALCLISLVGDSLSQPDEMKEKKIVSDNRSTSASTSPIEISKTNIPLIKPFGEMNGAPDGTVFHNWRGFALKGNESYVLRVSIESVRPVGPISIRKLLESNKTLEEVRKEMLAEEGNVTYRGHFSIGESTFRLINIKLIPTEENLTLDADITDPHAGSSINNSTEIAAAEIVGCITINTARNEREMQGQGILMMTGGQHVGSYKVLLDMFH